MPSGRRLPLGVIGAFLLVGLVGLLATLQYRWLGQVSQAEREQLRRSLDARARAFADEFDAEISALYVSLVLPREGFDTAAWPSFAAHVDRWRSTARHPRLLHAIYLADASGAHKTLRTYDEVARGFGPATDVWPERLNPVREQIAAVPPLPPSPSAGARFIAMALVPVAADVPALLVPVSRHVASTNGGAPSLMLERSGEYVVAELDASYILGTFVPALVARHFPAHDADSYRVGVVTGTGQVLYRRGFLASERLVPAEADLVAPFFSLRMDMARELLPGASPVSAPLGDRMSVVVEHREGSVSHAPGAPATAQIRVFRPGWRLVLAHVSGSLDVAVAKIRRRNLWLSFGILGVLAAGVVLVVVNGRRAGRLAAQQMDFVATVSHELRTPLAVIRSAAQNLSAGVVSEPERARRYGELIDAEGRRLTEMVEQVLEYARITGVQPVPTREPVDLGDVANDVAQSCRPLCDAAGVALDASVAEGVPLVVAGDEAALRRALRNLVMNALTHGADGRWIGVRVGRVTGRRGTEVLVTVTDRGRGIEPAEMGRVFEPFFRGTHAMGEQIHGSGLGLSLVKGVVEAHGGRVTVQSAPGQETTFAIHLPAAAMELPA